jgi:hypothetical protein
MIIIKLDPRVRVGECTLDSCGSEWITVAVVFGNSSDVQVP